MPEVVSSSADYSANLGHLVAQNVSINDLKLKLTDMTNCIDNIKSSKIIPSSGTSMQSSIPQDNEQIPRSNTKPLPTMTSEPADAYLGINLLNCKDKLNTQLRLETLQSQTIDCNKSQESTIRDIQQCNDRSSKRQEILPAVRDSNGKGSNPFNQTQRMNNSTPDLNLGSAEKSPPREGSIDHIKIKDYSSKSRFKLQATGLSSQDKESHYQSIVPKPFHSQISKDESVTLRVPSSLE